MKPLKELIKEPIDALDELIVGFNLKEIKELVNKAKEGKMNVFVKVGSKEYLKAKLKENQIENKKLKKKLENYDKIKKVRCHTCRKLVGIKRGNNFDLENGVWQVADDKGYLNSFCSKQCRDSPFHGNQSKGARDEE